MSKKSKKHDPGTEEVVRKPYAFMDKHEFVWTGFEWRSAQLGQSWFLQLRNRYYKFVFDRYDEFGLLDGWCTADHADQQILRCASHPVFSVDPDPMFLHRWIDVWVELHYCKIWNHVFDTLRLHRGVDETDAYYRASVIAGDFEALFEPTMPRIPVKPKRRKGSKPVTSEVMVAADPVIPYGYDQVWVEYWKSLMTRNGFKSYL